LAVVFCFVVAGSPTLSAPRGAQPIQNTAPISSLVGQLIELGEDYEEEVGERAQVAAEIYEKYVEWSQSLIEESKALKVHASIVQEFEMLARVIRGKGDGEDVVGLCERLVSTLISRHGLPQAPKRPVSLKRGRAMFATNCASCHGAQGQGDGSAAEYLDPRPVNFHEQDMAALSPTQVFFLLSSGSYGTAMPSFGLLTEAELWDLAFYVFTLRQNPCDRGGKPVTDSILARSSDQELESRYGTDNLACLRLKLSLAPRFKPSRPLATTR